MTKQTNASRREFLLLSAGTVTTLALSACDLAPKVETIGGDVDIQDQFSVPTPDRVVGLSGDSQSFPIPPLLVGEVIDGKRVFNLTMQTGSKEFISGIQTPTLAYNGDYLGPTLIMRKGEDVVLNVTNQTGEPSTTHWHGLHVPATMDGTPHQTIQDGETWTASFTILNRASTYWYHPHTHPSERDPLTTISTGGQVWRGLAGMLIVNDDESERLGLPSTYGLDDIPLIIQDRAFNDDGTFNNEPVLSAILRKGETILVNGEVSPTLVSHAQLIRFRIHNASNARIYNLGFSDHRQFYQIGSDGGLLETPVPLSRLILAPAERADIVVDFADDENASLKLRSYNSEFGTSVVPNPLADDFDRIDFDIFAIEVGPPSDNRIMALRDSLTAINHIVAEEAVNVDNPRLFVLNDVMREGTRINGKKMDMNRIDETVRLGDTEIWEVTNEANMTHPFHVHGDSFQVLTRNGALPPENERGWKDVVLVYPQETIHIIKAFEDFADPEIPYMYHCHILEHEDAGMMGQFVVVSD